ncbi:MAG: ROK family protein [Prevotellaceae bacterium]|jgi:glucokinase|nr:ROK family protein [Prevotellaceae bacterium]
MPVIGIDLGGTKITGAVFSREGEILYKQSALLEQRQGKEVGELVRAIISKCSRQSAVAVGSRQSDDSGYSNSGASPLPTENCPLPTAIGVCVPGIANSKTGKVWAPNIAGWEDYPLQQELEASFPAAKINIASDRTCYILGECWKGAAQGCSNALFIAVGTGIGLGILADGRVLHGHGDIVGATGWMALESPYREEYKRYGCFESHASGNGIARQAQKILEEGHLFKDSPLYHKTPASITTQELFEYYAQNDPLAMHVLDRAITLWGMAAANLTSLFNPEKIIWGGGVFGPAAVFLARIYHEACRWAQPLAIRQVSFEPSRLCGNAGLFGAGSLGSMR